MDSQPRLAYCQSKSRPGKCKVATLGRSTGWPHRLCRLSGAGVHHDDRARRQETPRHPFAWPKHPAAIPHRRPVGVRILETGILKKIGVRGSAGNRRSAGVLRHNKRGERPGQFDAVENETLSSQEHRVQSQRQK